MNDDPLMGALDQFWRMERAKDSAKARIRRCIAKGEIVHQTDLSEWIARRWPDFDAATVASIAKEAFEAKVGRYRV